MRLSLPRPMAAILLLAVVTALALVRPAPAQTAVAQTSVAQTEVQPSPTQPRKAGSGSRGAFMDRKTASSQNLAKAEEEDEEYVFKHSASVRAFARIFHVSPDGASMAFWALNAALLFVFIGYFLATGLPKAFRSRRQQLERQMVEAQSATEQANDRMRVVEERLSRLDSEIAAVRAQAEQDSINDERRIQQSMEEEKRKIVALAEQEIAAAGAAAERHLRRFAAELAVDRATSRLRLSEGDDRTLIQEFAASLGADGSKGGRN